MVEKRSNQNIYEIANTINTHKHKLNKQFLFKERHNMNGEEIKSARRKHTKMTTMQFGLSSIMTSSGYEFFAFSDIFDFQSTVSLTLLACERDPYWQRKIIAVLECFIHSFIEFSIYYQHTSPDERMLRMIENNQFHTQCLV